MFEVPEAKRVKRSELFDEASSASSTSPSDHESVESEDDSDSRSKLVTKKSKKSTPRTSDSTSEPMENDLENDIGLIDYGFEYDFIDVAGQAPPQTTTTKELRNDDNLQGDTHAETEPHENQADSKEQTFEFLLFKPTPRTTTLDNQKEGTEPGPIPPSTTKKRNLITIRSPTPESALDAVSGSIVKPRPQTHYFTSLAPLHHQQLLQAQYQESAITSSAIEALSRAPWKGTHLPWRVIHIPTSRAPPQDLGSRFRSRSVVTGGVLSSRMSRARPSKKRRILVRQRVALRLSQQAALRETAELQDAAEREKRTRRNREKKVKRKEREKRKKVEATMSMEMDTSQIDDVDGAE